MADAAREMLLLNTYRELQLLRSIPFISENFKSKNSFRTNIQDSHIIEKIYAYKERESKDLGDSIPKGIITRSEQELVRKLYEKDNIQKLLLEVNDLSLKYSAAISYTETTLRILNEDLKIKKGHSPIEHIESRMKSPESILKKMMRNNFPFTIDSVKENVKDIAGVRIICSFKSDIFELVNLIKNISDFEIIKEKNYVTNPKDSGYRSYHIIVKVPVQFSTGKESVLVEIQIRTIAMDFWASLEHQINYKYDGVVPEDVRDELKDCAEEIAKADDKMMNLADKVKNLNLSDT